MAQTPTDPTKAQVWITKGIDDLDFEFYIPSGPKGDPGGLTYGTNLGANNLNDYLTSGVYRQGVTADATLLRNYPMDQQSGTMLVIERVTANTVTQIFYPIYIPSLQFIRMYNNGTWSTWRSFGSTRVDQTAGRAIYQWDAVNNREQLTYGDTGMRDVSTLLAQGTGTVYLRRMGYQVELVMNSYNRPTVDPGGQYTIMTLPYGFKPQTGLPCHPLFQSNGTAAMFDISGASGVFKVLAHPAAGNWYGRLTWMTNDMWPTSLPGVASGGIVNL